MTFARNKSKEGPDRLRRRLLAAGAAAALCPAHALAGHREDLQQDWDVIVIGTGMAGLTAAVSAREAGAVRVLLLEKGPLVGGHTLYAAGSVAVLSPRRQAPIGFMRLQPELERRIVCRYYCGRTEGAAWQRPSYPGTEWRCGFFGSRRVAASCHWQELDLYLCGPRML